MPLQATSLLGSRDKAEAKAKEKMESALGQGFWQRYLCNQHCPVVTRHSVMDAPALSTFRSGLGSEQPGLVGNGIGLDGL